MLGYPENPKGERQKGDTKMYVNVECPLKTGLRCPVLNAKRVNKGIVNIIRDGRCYAEMCDDVNRLVYNNPWDGFGSNAGYDPDEFSLISAKKRGD